MYDSLGYCVVVNVPEDAEYNSCISERQIQFEEDEMKYLKGLII